MASAHDVISRELDGDELLLWAGAPKKGIYFRTWDFIRIPWFTIFCGGAIYLEYTAIANPYSWPFAIIYFPFVLCGLYFAVGRFYVDAKTRSTTVYGVSNRRIIIITHFLYRRTQSIPLATLQYIGIEERHDGSGIISMVSAISN